MLENVSLNDLRVPLILIVEEEKKVCQGHKEFAGKYNTREKAKEIGFEWLKKVKEDPLLKNEDFDVRLSNNKHQLIKFFSHVEDVQSCNCFLIQSFFKSIPLECRRYIELVPCFSK